MAEEFLGICWTHLTWDSSAFNRSSHAFCRVLNKRDRKGMRKHYNIMLREVKKIYEHEHGEGSWDA